MEDPPFIGDWQREKKLGSGGFGVVNLWKNRKTNQCVAIKRCHPSGSSSTEAAVAQAKERWNREVQYMTNIVRHENIVLGIKIKPESFLDELNKHNPSPMPVLVMEYCEGGDLRRKLNGNRYTSGFPESEARDILKSLGSAIAYLHKLKITHRDIKPENIVSKQDASGRTIYKLTDLGYAKPLDHQTIVASLVGTLEYIAPELCMTDRYTNSVDYWSLGVIAFEILTGTRPFVTHLPLAQWMITVKAKSSADICITENPSGQIVYSKQLPAQHRISSCLASLLEPWLQIALEWNPKQRGQVFKTDPAQVTNSKDSFPPILELKIFSMLDSVLAKRILTVFSLHTYERLSYEINNATSMATLKALISKDTRTDPEKIRFVLHIKHPSMLDKIDDTTKPIEMYWPDQDLPMCYVYSIGDHMRSVGPLTFSPVVAEVLASPQQKYKPQIIKRFAFDTFYMYCREEQMYSDLVDGLHSLALLLNHEVVVQESKVDRMVRMAYNLEGAMAVVDATPKVEQEVNFGNLSADTKTVVNACDKIHKRYRSLHRRSTALNSNRLFDRKGDPFGIAGFEKTTFEILRVQLLQKASAEKQHQEMMRLVKSCSQRREQLLSEKDMTSLLSVFGMALELEEIEKTLGMGIAQTQKYQRDVHQMHKEHHDSIMKMIDQTTKPNGEYLPDIAGIGSSTITAEIEPPMKVVATHDVVAKTPMSPTVPLIDFGQGEDAASLIMDNLEMHTTFESLIKELRGELDITN